MHSGAMMNLAVIIFLISLALAKCVLNLQIGESVVSEHGVSRTPSDVAFPLQILTDGQDNSIHRFFHSSPFSPSNKYVVVVQMPSPQSFVREVSPRSSASVKLIDLSTEQTTIIERTNCWDSQVGAHAQWGATDEQLMFNALAVKDTTQQSIIDSESSTVPAAYHDAAFTNHVRVRSQSEDGSSYTARGVVYDMLNNSRSYLDCPVYHVRHDGKYSAAPNLHKIQYQQKGYGIRTYSGSARNRRAIKKDGLFINDIATGHCILLVTLRELAQFAGFDLHNTPTYGFHTKWSSDGKFIMFTVRTMEAHATRGGMALTMLGSSLAASVRVQHLFVIDFEKAMKTRAGEHHPSARGIRHIVSWASKPFRRRDCRINSPAAALRLFSSNGEPYTTPEASSAPAAAAVQNSARDGVPSRGSTSASAEEPKCRIIHLRDGNHPNWVADSHHISMNLQSAASSRADSIQYSAHHRKARPKWSIVVFDVDALPEKFSFGQHGNIQLLNYSERLRAHMAARSYAEGGKTALLPAFEASSVGTGHPNFLPGGRYILVDSYAKEANQLATYLPQYNIRDALSMPLRLIDAHNQQEWWPLQMQILKSAAISNSHDRFDGGLLRDLSRLWRGTTDADDAAAVNAGNRILGPLEENADRDDGAQSNRMSEKRKKKHRRSMRSLHAQERAAAAATAAAAAVQPLEMKQHQSQLGEADTLMEDASWRCDMHPAFSRDYQYVALNGRPHGMERQVIIFKTKDMLDAFNITM